MKRKERFTNSQKGFNFAAAKPKWRNAAKHALLQAVKDNNERDVRSLLGNPNIYIDEQDDSGLTALMLAAKYGFVHILSLILQYVQDEADTDIVSAAMKEGSGSNPGFEVNMQDPSGLTALMHAAEEGHRDCVSVLLQYPGISANCTCDEDFTALMCAADAGHEECLKLLLAVSGIDVNLQDEFGNTALVCATDAGHAECVKLLLAHP